VHAEGLASARNRWPLLFAVGINNKKSGIKMKQKYILAVLLIAGMATLFTACKKGDPGDPGADGASVLSGAGIPSTSIGKVGDFFVDTVGKVIWGPKNTVNWGAGAALVGPQGLPGKSVLNGAGAPAAALGTIGDFYIDITAKAIYGPKTAAGWGAATSLIGPTGATGATGAQGPQGIQGIQGIQGPVGPQGIQGIQGPAGTPAQIIYSPWITSPYNSRDTTIDGTCLRLRHIDAPSLSATILNQGVMITYFRVGSIGPYQLPYTSDAGGSTNMINCVFNQQKILVYRHTFNTCRFNSGIPESFPGQPVLINLPQSLEYRYVLIPGLISGGRMANGGTRTVDLHNVMIPGRQQPVDLTKMSYAQVCNMLGIAQ
jgi:hypothetical protein